jgi:hypothetical protein
MNYRLATILSSEAHSSDTTKPLDIDIRDPISQIIITHEPTNGSQIYANGHPAACISLIELVDGSDVLFSLSGKEAQAADFYHRKMSPPNILLYTNGMNSEMVYIINFGRYLWDPLYALDPTKFQNLKLNITIDVDAGGSAVSTGNLTVMAQIFDEKTITPLGFLMHKEIKSFTLVNSAYEYTDLPTDFAYRKLFVRAQRDGTGPEYQVDTIKLSEDTDKRVVLNHTMFQLLRTIMAQTPPYREWIIGPGATSAQYFFCTPAYWPAFAASLWRAATTPAGICIYAGDGGRFTESQEGSGPNWQAHVEGWAPHGVIEIPFGLQDDPADWYNVSQIGNLKLTVRGGGSVGSLQTSEIFLQQLRTYAA